jgi:hypothetical protein
LGPVFLCTAKYKEGRLMDVLTNKSDVEIAQSILAETAKAKNEIASAEADIRKAKSRLGFLIVLANEMIDRTGD